MNTEQLKQAAMAATPGPWLYVRLDEWSHSVCTRHGELPDGSPSYWAIASINKQREPEHEANASFIAAANPATILALLECVDALRLQRTCIEENLAVLSGGKKFHPVETATKSGAADAAVIAALQKLETLS